MSKGRIWAGVAIAVAGVALLTGLLVGTRDSVSLASVVLLFLVPVVAAAVVGGMWPALGAVMTADLAVNFFFVPPYHTFVVESGNHVIVLVVYVLVAGAVSVAVDVAARQRATATRREVEAALLANATAEPVAEQSLTRLLSQVRATFGMNAVALLEREGAAERVVAAVGAAPEAEPVMSARAGDGLRLAAWGDRVFAEDRRTLARMATAAARTLEAQRLADEAAHARDLAEIDRVRASLLAAVGHDLRTPLAGIKAAVGTLRQPELILPPEDRAELLAGVEEATDRLDALVENLLSMSRLQAGVLSVHSRPVALDGVVAEALLHIRIHDATVDVPDDLPLGYADPGLLERVVANLLANAEAASPFGCPVEVRGRTEDDRVFLDVIDHGSGVPPADRERIFEPFQRLHDRTTTAGLGLGLAIARGFTTAMGGSLSPSETPNGGLTMTVELPVAAP
ncbi:MAG TPA: ATP-binding protein [Micromonosporaceae bacterium]